MIVNRGHSISEGSGIGWSVGLPFPRRPPLKGDKNTGLPNTLNRTRLGLNQRPFKSVRRPADARALDMRMLRHPAALALVATHLACAEHRSGNTAAPPAANAHISAAASGNPASSAAIVKSVCSSGNVVCVYASVDTSAGTATFAVTSASKNIGWLAFGTGTSMSNSNMFVAFNNKGQPVLSQRFSKGEVMPSMAPQQLITQTTVPISFAIPASNSFAFAFTVPLSANIVSTSASSDLIYAASSRAPSDPTNVAASFTQHNLGRGTFQLDLSGAAGSMQNSNSTTSVGATISQASACSPNKEVCLVVTRDAVSNMATFVVYSTNSGWAAIGTGSQMDGSTMFVGWSNGNHDPLISQRSTSGHNTPSPVSSVIFRQTSVPSSLNLPSSAVLSFAFTVPMSASIISATGPSTFIFASSKTSPSTPSDPASSFPKHDIRGAFQLDVSKLGSISVGTAEDDNTMTLWLVHGTFMFLGWIVLPPFAIFVARYLKSRLGHTWYLTHMNIMLFGVATCLIGGLVCVELTVPNGQARFITTSHGILGLVLCFVIYPLQVTLGFISNALFKPDRVAVPIQDQAHWWLGRIAVLLALVNVQLGLGLYGANTAVVVLYWTFVVLIMLGLFGYVGEWKLGGARHHVMGGFYGNKTSSTPVEEPMLERGVADIGQSHGTGRYQNLE